MKDIGSFNFINFKDKNNHQKLLDSYFIKALDKNKLIDINSNNLNLRLTSLIGEVGLTILGSNEKDYNFYNDFNKYLDEINFILKSNKIDNIKIPLLSKKGALEIKQKIEKINFNYLFNINLSSVSPIIDKKKFKKNKKSYLRQINKFLDEGFVFNKVNSVEDSVKKLHFKRWGDNRSNNFFKMLDFMLEKNIAYSYGLYKKNKLVSYIFLIKTGDTLHYYYSIFDDRYSGAGSCIILYAIKLFLEDLNLRYFSFGRGSETYKHRWATDIVENYELRGFLKK